MVDEFGRKGKLVGAGFYDYADGKRAGLWPGLREHFGASRPRRRPARDCQERMLFIEAIETVRASTRAC